MTADDSRSRAPHPLRFGIYVEHQLRTWSDIRDICQAADQSGWDSIWLFDHFIPERADELGACFESWTLLSAVAGSTERARLGVLVSGNTYRNPALLAKQAVTVDHVSGGRLNLGVGTGWRELEHRAYGWNLPQPGELVDRFGEAMEVIRLLETSERATFRGRFYRLDEAPFVPKPVGGHMPLTIGAFGPRMLRHVGRYADQWDTWGTPERIRANAEIVAEAAVEAGRDPGAIERSICVGNEPLGSEAALRAHVERYATAGVTTHIFNVDLAEPVAAITRAAGWIGSLRGPV